jgi:hypothetical protein
LRRHGYRVWGINPKAVDRYRDRHASSGAKSDPGDALVLANILRTDAHAHFVLPRDSDQAMAVGVLARAHTDLTRRRRGEANVIRNLLREYFPAALTAFPNLDAFSVVTVLSAAPTPTAAAALTHEDLVALLARAGRVGRPDLAARLHRIFAEPQLQMPGPVEAAMGVALQALLSGYGATLRAVKDLETHLTGVVAEHPDAGVMAGLPGLGPVLTARLIGEFGDDPERFPHAGARRSYAGMAPVTRASGKKRVVVLRRARNRRLSDACRLWAFAALTASPGARAHYDRRRARGDAHEAALRNLANKLVGQLDHCLRHRQAYLDAVAWPPALAPDDTDTRDTDTGDTDTGDTDTGDGHRISGQ